jgi:hypothetical protein
MKMKLSGLRSLAAPRPPPHHLTSSQHPESISRMAHGTNKVCMLLLTPLPTLR